MSETNKVLRSLIDYREVVETQIASIIAQMENTETETKKTAILGVKRVLVQQTDSLIDRVSKSLG